MGRTFQGYHNISYEEKCKDVESLPKKNQNSQKIVSITKNSSYIQNYWRDLMNKFSFRIFVYFVSGFFSAIVSNMFEFHLHRMIHRYGYSDKIKYFKIEIK